MSQLIELYPRSIQARERQLCLEIEREIENLPAEQKPFANVIYALTLWARKKALRAVQERSTTS